MGVLASLLSSHWDIHVGTPNEKLWCGFRSEQYFGNPTEAASAAEVIRERLLLVEERRLQLQEIGLRHEEEAPDRQEAWLDMIGEDLREKEEQEEVEEDEEEEEEEEGQEDEDLTRATQDR